MGAHSSDVDRALGAKPITIPGDASGVNAPARNHVWRLRNPVFLPRLARQFLRSGLDEQTPDHSTISRTRRLIDVKTHRKVFLWVLGVLAYRGLLKGRTVGVDATTLEANAARRSIVREAEKAPAGCSLPVALDLLSAVTSELRAPPA